MHSTSAATHPHPWRVFAATSMGVVAVFVSMSGLTVALPTLTRELSASPAQSTWILLGYMLVTTALILVFGRMADIIGRRPLYLAGLVVFTAATGLCVLVPSAEWMIVVRLLQGVGAAAVITNNTALLTDTFPPDQLGRALGANATVAATAQVIGPVVGGLATAAIGWRGLFIVVLGCAIVATAASLWTIPATPHQVGRRERFDLTGAVLSTVLLTMVVLVLTPGVGIGSTWGWYYLGVALCTAVAFVAVQIRRAEPLIDLTLFGDRAISLIFTAALLIAVATYAVALVISLFAQAVDGTSPSIAGILVTPLAIGTVISATVAGALVSRVSPRVTTSVGMVLVTIGLLVVTLLLSPSGLPLAATLSALFVIGAGIGLFMTPSTSALMLTVSAERRGIANGMRSTLQNVGNLLSTAIVLAIVPVGLGVHARQAAYSGSPSALTTAELTRFVDNLQLACVVLTATAALGVLACLALPRSPIGSARSAIDIQTGNATETMSTIRESA